MLSHVICSKVLCKIVGIKDTRIYWTRFVEEIHEGSNTLMLARVGCALGEKMPTLSHVSGRHAEHRASCWLPRKGALLHRTFMHVVVGGICIQLGLDLQLICTRSSFSAQHGDGKCQVELGMVKSTFASQKQLQCEPLTYRSGRLSTAARIVAQD